MLITKEKAPVNAPVANSAPRDFILQSFNIFDPQIAKDISRLFSRTSNYIKTPLTDSQINTQTFAQRFSSEYSVYQSSQESESSFSASMGISGSYGFYSGSVSASYKQDTYQASTAFRSAFNAVIDCGTITYNQQGDFKAIRACLKDELLQKLDDIKTLNDADEFGHTYGTHLILGLNLGGTIQLRTEADTTDYRSKKDVAAAVNAAYNGVGSISAAANAAQTLSEQSHTYSLRETAGAAGGESGLAITIDPQDKKTIIAWGQSCSENTVYGITDVLEIWKLAANNVAKEMFKQLTDLVILNQSINNPSVFTAITPLVPYNLTTVEAITTGAKFRIIGGGASLDRNGSSFLIDSYPVVDEASGDIAGWKASCHDINDPADPNNYLTSYAIAIYDPSFDGDDDSSLLKRSLAKGKGSNPGAGGDTATAKIDDGYLLSGGGIRSYTINNTPKYIMGSYPSDKYLWTAINHDYAIAANNVQLTAFAIGIAVDSNVLIVKPTMNQVENPQSEYIKTDAVLGGGANIAGGGVFVGAPSGAGNLVQQSYPSASNTWTTYFKDLGGNVSNAVSAGYALGFTSAIKL